MCPLCGKEKIYRERRYTEKPNDKHWDERVQIEEVYDYCDV